MRREYVKPVCTRISQLDPKTNAAVMKRPASSSSTHYHTLAGDNCAEGLFGTNQTSRTRMNLTGRRTGARAHINTLAAMYLVSNPGVDNVLKALGRYRAYAQAHMPPNQAYGKNATFKWLWKPVDDNNEHDSDDSRSDSDDSSSDSDEYSDSD